MLKKFRTKIKGGCQSETKAAHQHSCIDLTLELTMIKAAILLVDCNLQPILAENSYLSEIFDRKTVLYFQMLET